MKGKVISMGKKRLVVIGGVAAGTKAASKARRENPEMEIVIITKDRDISYAGCGLPYFLSGVIKEKSELVVRGPEEFKVEQNITVLTKREAININPEKKRVTYIEIDTGKEENIDYDYLVIATGASPFFPPIPGIDLKNIYPLRTVEDAQQIRQLVDGDSIKEAVVVGAGFVGLEAAENLAIKGIKTTVLEMGPFVLPGYDEEMSLYIKNYLKEKGLNVQTGIRVESFLGDEDGKVTKVKAGEQIINAQCVIWAAGVRPNVGLAEKTGIKLGPTRTIAVNEFQESNIPDIYAVGDCAENINLITQEPVWYPMGSTANKTGRIAGLNIGKEKKDYLPGVLGTSVIKLFELQAARTGLTEKQAREHGYDVETVIVPANDRAHYYPGYRQIIIKLIADKKERKILGAQIVGEGTVDKPIDIIVTLISCGGTVEQMTRLDLAYAPPFSMALSSNILAAHVLLNKLDSRMQGINPREFFKVKDNEDIILLDVRTEVEYLIKSIPGSLNIPADQLKERVHELDPAKKIVVVCRIGRKAYQNLQTLRTLGFSNTAILEGGIEAYPYPLD